MTRVRDAALREHEKHRTLTANTALGPPSEPTPLRPKGCLSTLQAILACWVLRAQAQKGLEGRTGHYLDRECIEVVQHDVVGLRKQRWITLRDKVRHEQEFGVKMVPAHYFMAWSGWPRRGGRP